MKLIITESIRKAELLPMRHIFPIEALKMASRKALEGMGDSVKSSSKLPQACLKKLSLTSSGGAGRHWRRTLV